MAQPMNTQDALQLVLPVIDVLERLGVAYRIGGSVASGYYGLLRGTHDVDLVADLQMQHVAPFVAAFDPNVYLVVDHSVVDAIIHQSQFNIIDLRTMNKIDVFIQEHTPFAQQGQQRAHPVVLVPGTRPLWMASAEDMILQKIHWWQLGGGISTTQWDDIVQMLRRQSATLDRPYLAQNATTLNITTLLQQACADAGVPFP